MLPGYLLESVENLTQYFLGHKKGFELGPTFWGPPQNIPGQCHNCFENGPKNWDQTRNIFEKVPLEGEIKV